MDAAGRTAAPDPHQLPIMPDLLAASRAARKAGEIAHAVALARQAREIAPNRPEPAFLLCCLLLERRDPGANDLIGVVEGFPGFASGWEELGDALMAVTPSAGRMALQRAAEAYAVSEAQTADAELSYRLGMVLRRLGRLDQACAAMERATRRDPAAAGAWYSLGLIRQDLHDGPGAVQAFRAALAARPDFHEAAFNLGVACQECSDLDAALNAYAAAWRLRPDSFGRVAQALVSHASGRLWLRPSTLLRELSART